MPFVEYNPFMPSADAPVLCFGEVLWDSLPRGFFLGGAPCNVAYHLTRLGTRALPVSAVGNDFLGQEILRRVEAWGIETDLIAVLDDVPTGVVHADVSRPDSPIYTIMENVAWDFIPETDALHQAAASASALVFGTLALREAYNATLLRDLLDALAGVAIFDVNLRAPYIDLPMTLRLAGRADLTKLNDQELTELTPDANALPLSERAAWFAETTGCRQVVVTCGDKGAGLWNEGLWHWAEARPVTVKDAVGAGDAFLAALVRSHQTGIPPQAALERACRLAEFVASQDGATPEYDPAQFE